MGQSIQDCTVLLTILAGGRGFTATPRSPSLGSRFSAAQISTPTHCRVVAYESTARQVG